MRYLIPGRQLTGSGDEIAARDMVDVTLKEDTFDNGYVS